MVSAGELCGAGIWRPAEAGQGGDLGPIMLGLMAWGSWTFSHSTGLAARGSGEGTVGPTLQGPAVQRDQSVCEADFWPLPRQAAQGCRGAGRAGISSLSPWRLLSGRLGAGLWIYITETQVQASPQVQPVLPLEAVPTLFLYIAETTPNRRISPAKPRTPCWAQCCGRRGEQLRAGHSD